LKDVTGLQETAERVVSPETQLKYATTERARLERNSFQEFAWNTSLSCAVANTSAMAMVASQDEQDTPEFARALSSISTPEEKCHPEKVQIQCKSTRLADSLSKYCMAKSTSEHHAEVFSKTCTGCVNNFYKLYISKGLEDRTKESEKDRLRQLEGLFNGDAGAAYCRCLSRFMDSMHRHSQMVMNFTWFFIVFQAALFASVCWLILCGPETEAREQSPSSIEMNIGMQPSGSVGQSRSMMPPSAYGGDPNSQAPPQQVAVMCPHDAGPGMLVNVTTSSGRQAQVRVPPGVMPGQMFTAFV